jgi:hypothetical protein
MAADIKEAEDILSKFKANAHSCSIRGKNITLNLKDNTKKDEATEQQQATSDQRIQSG